MSSIYTLGIKLLRDQLLQIFSVVFHFDVHPLMHKSIDSDGVQCIYFFLLFLLPLTSLCVYVFMYRLI